MANPNEVVEHMMQNDLFSQWLGISVIEIKEGLTRDTVTRSQFQTRKSV